MASASIRFFMKDADAVKDADADQCKRTFSLFVLSQKLLLITISSICRLRNKATWKYLTTDGESEHTLANECSR